MAKVIKSLDLCHRALEGINHVLVLQDQEIKLLRQQLRELTERMDRA